MKPSTPTPPGNSHASGAAHSPAKDLANDPANSTMQEAAHDSAHAGGLPPPTLPPAPPSATARKATLRLGIDYMPLLLALILALGTFWLVRSMPKTGPAEPAPPANAPDYYLHDFQLRRYGAQGHLQDELTGQYGEHLPGPDTIHVQQATMHAINPQGGSTQGRANRAVAALQSKDIELFDQVRVVHQPAPDAKGQVPPEVTFESEYLQSTDSQEHIRTHRPVKITRQGSVITGSGMHYTNSSRTVEVQGRAKAVIQPSPAPKS